MLYNGFSTLKILATVKLAQAKEGYFLSFSTLKILATVKHPPSHNMHTIVLVPLRF